MQIGIVEDKDFSPKVLEELREMGTVEVFKGECLKSFIENKDVLFIRLKFNFDKELLSYGKNLKYICSPTTGLNHIDLDETSKRGISIISLKGEFEFLKSIRATPEHTFGLVLALLRNYKECFLSKSNSSWNRDLYKGYELYGKKVGIIGLGRVGAILSKYFNAFDCEVLYYDIDNSKSSEYAKKQDSVEELIIGSDIVILSASYSEENRDFFDKKYIDLLCDKYFVNTARGELVDENYLLSKIKEDFFKGIGIDVIANESQDDNLLEKFLSYCENKNILLTSHIAGATYESMWKTEEFILKKLRGIL